MRLIDADALKLAICRDLCAKDGCDYHCSDIAYVEEAPTVSGWISVKDRMPEEKKWVICHCRAGIREVLRWKNGKWYHDPQHYFESFVLYWMPLPEPPKENVNED